MTVPISDNDRAAWLERLEQDPDLTLPEVADLVRADLAALEGEQYLRVGTRELRDAEGQAFVLSLDTVRARPAQVDLAAQYIRGGVIETPPARA